MHVLHRAHHPRTGDLPGAGDVLDEVRALASSGTAEVEFLGQTVNAYRDSAGGPSPTFSARGKVEGIRRIRFTTSHPAQMTDELMDAMAEAAPVVAPYFTFPCSPAPAASFAR